VRSKPSKGAVVHDLFRQERVDIINVRHELVRLADVIDWLVFDREFGAQFVSTTRRPTLATCLVAGLPHLKHAYALSDEDVIERWVENPYFQHFCYERYIRHELTCDPSSLVRWRKRIGKTGAPVAADAYDRGCETSPANRSLNPVYSEPHRSLDTRLGYAASIPLAGTMPPYRCHRILGGIHLAHTASLFPGIECVRANGFQDPPEFMVQVRTSPPNQFRQNQLHGVTDDSNPCASGQQPLRPVRAHFNLDRVDQHIWAARRIPGDDGVCIEQKWINDNPSFPGPRRHPKLNPPLFSYAKHYSVFWFAEQHRSNSTENTAIKMHVYFPDARLRASFDRHLLSDRNGALKSTQRLLAVNSRTFFSAK